MRSGRREPMKRRLQKTGNMPRIRLKFHDFPPGDGARGHKTSTALTAGSHSSSTGAAALLTTAATTVTVAAAATAAAQAAAVKRRHRNRRVVAA